MIFSFKTSFFLDDSSAPFFLYPIRSFCASFACNDDANPLVQCIIESNVKNKLLNFFHIYTKDKNKYLKTLRIILLYFYKNNNSLQHK